MSKLGLIFGIPLAILALTGILVVDVRDGGPDGTHIVVPVPVLLAQVALAVMPQNIGDCHETSASHHGIVVGCGGAGAARGTAVACREGAEAARYLPFARAMLKDLRRYPDFTLVEVRDGQDHVLVRKVGKDLVVDVTDSQDDVHCRVPLRMADRVLASFSEGRVSPRGIAGALWALPHGDLVRVHSASGDQVRITRL